MSYFLINLCWDFQEDISYSGHSCKIDVGILLPKFGRKKKFKNRKLRTRTA